MSEERYDLVIFGATGFTGQFVVEEMVRVQEEEGGSLTMAVAGRNMEKLQKVLEQASKHTGKDLEKTPIIIADVTSEASLAEMCKQARIVLNCVGPYRFYGEQVVKACIENGAHHLDISGEPQYLEKMQLLYGGKAREAGLYIIGACGFDSVPSDMGVAFTRDNFAGDLNSIEFYVRAIAGPEGIGGNITTLESALHGFAHGHELKPLRKSLFPTPLPRSQYKIEPKSASHHPVVDAYCINFPGSDRAIINRSVRYEYDVNKLRPFQVAAYAYVGSLFNMAMMLFFGFWVMLLAKFSFGRWLILKYPGLFTAGIFKKGGPSRKQIEGNSFSITIVGKGWKTKTEDPDTQHEGPPDQKIVTRVSGPEAGYVATPICLIQCGVVLMKEKDKLPTEGGVYTTASAFRHTTLIDRLQKHNVKFEILEQGDL